MDGPYIGGVALVDENKNPINSGNPVPVSQAPSGGTLLHVRGDVNVAGTNVLVGGVAGQRVRVWRLIVYLYGVNTWRLQSAGVDISSEYGASLALDLGAQEWWAGSVANNLQLVVGAATRIVWDLWYTQAP